MQWTRREWLAACTLVASRVDASPKGASLLLTSTDQLAAMRPLASRSPALKDLTASAVKAGPWSVTFHRPGHVQVGTNDYFSEGPYWWPDPKNPGGPYIRRDGERNPNRFMHNRNDLGEMCTTVLVLGLASTLLNDNAAADHANKVLSVWFVEPKTRMNPNLEHGQAIRGINDGRNAGMIDTVSLIHCAQGVTLLDTAGDLDAALGSGVRKWYADYLDWMWTSELGRKEQRSGNNHATWYAAQSAAYAILTGNAARQQEIWDLYRNYLVPTEIQPDGSCPREEARTKSLGYSAMNLDAFAVLCRLAQQTGVDLWHYHDPKTGIGVDRAFDYLAPYIAHPETWQKQQIEPFKPDSTIFPGLSGVGLKSDSLLKVYKALPRAKTPWVLFNDWIVQTS